MAGTSGNITAGIRDHGTDPARDLQSLAADLGGEAIDPNRGGYTITMRENRNAPAVLQALRTLPGGSPRMHIGWGSFRNLDIAAARGSEFALLFDINVHQLNVWRLVAQAIEHTTDPEAFTRVLAGLMPAAPRPRRFAASDLDWLQSDLSRRESWLYAGAPERFAHIRALFRRRAVGVCGMDIRGSESPSRRLSHILPALGNPHIDTIYVSNLPYMMRQPKDFFGTPNEAWAVEVRGTDGRPYRLGAYERLWLNVIGFCERSTQLLHAEQLIPGATAEHPWWMTEAGPVAVEIERCLHRFHAERPALAGNMALFRERLAGLRDRG